MGKKGVSLVQVIAVIVIMGVIAGIAVPTTIGIIRRQEKKACEQSCLNVSQHFASNMMFNINPEEDPHDVLKISLEECNCHEVSEHMYKGICPSALCKVELDSLNNITIYCEKHGGIENILNVNTLFNTIFETSQFQTYFNADRIDRTSLDSTGGNFGTPITHAIENSLDISLEDYSWKIVRPVGARGTSDMSVFTMYLTPIDISKRAVGDTVGCTKYTFNEDGTIKDQTIVNVKIAEKIIDNKDYINHLDCE